MEIDLESARGTETAITFFAVPIGIDCERKRAPMIDPTLALVIGSMVAGFASMWVLRPVQEAKKFLV
jgi:hypothetical protein